LFRVFAREPRRDQKEKIMYGVKKTSKLSHEKQKYLNIQERQNIYRRVGKNVTEIMTICSV